VAAVRVVSAGLEGLRKTLDALIEADAKMRAVPTICHPKLRSWRIHVRLKR
jgi:hypothetical protein